MDSFRLWLHPLHSRKKAHSPLRVDEMQHASSHDERIAILREVCGEASTCRIELGRLAEVIIHPTDLVARGEQVENPMRLPLPLSQVCEWDMLATAEERSDGVIGFVAYGYPMTEYTAQWLEGEAKETSQADVWVFVVTAPASCVPSAHRATGVLSQALHMLIDRGAIAGDTSGFEVVDDRTATGGFGTVRFFQRKHDEGSRIYAGKILESAEAMSACTEGGYLLAARSHPNIVAYAGTFCILTPLRKRKWMIVTEAHLGGDVDSRVRHYGAFSDYEALNVSRDLLKAVSHLHEHSLIHRDVKPANVVLASDGRAVLIDFGLAVHVSETVKRKQPCGTPGFAAPEILHRSGCQLKSDVFGCGAFLYFVASGRTPFAASSKQETVNLNARADVNFNDPRFLTIAVHTIEFMRNMLQRKPSRRPNARSARDAITFVIEMTSPLELPGETSHMLHRTPSKTGEPCDTTSGSTRQGIWMRLRAFSSLKTDDVPNSFSSSSSACSSGCSSVGGRRQTPVTQAKTKRFFLKAGELLRRTVQVKRAHANVEPFVETREVA